MVGQSRGTPWLGGRASRLATGLEAEGAVALGAQPALSARTVAAFAHNERAPAVRARGTARAVALKGVRVGEHRVKRVAHLNRLVARKPL